MVCLNEENVPGASLPEPLEKQSVPVLKRWNQDAKKYKKNAAANSVRNSRNFLSECIVLCIWYIHHQGSIELVPISTRYRSGTDFH